MHTLVNSKIIKEYNLYQQMTKMNVTYHHQNNLLCTISIFFHLTENTAVNILASNKIIDKLPQS